MATRQERLLKMLEDLGGSSGNKRLREALGWQEETYDHAKAALLAEGRIVKRPGQGGSVCLTAGEALAPHASPRSPRQGRRPQGAEPAAPAPAAADFRQTFRALDNVLRQEAAQTTELDYTEQTSWMLFLKYLEHREEERADEAALAGRQHRPILDEAHSWSAWAAPRRADGQFDHDRALTGDDLLQFINNDLWPYLQEFKARATGPHTLEYKVGEIFGEIKPKFASGYALRDALELIDQLGFRSQAERYELSEAYEAKIARMGNAGRNGGEYYTPRALIRAMVQVVAPQIGERVYDGACGSAGFLCEAYDYMRPQAKGTSDLETLQTRTFVGREKKSLAYVIGVMNMILHGIEAPDIVHANTLVDDITSFAERDRFEVVLANPPFGGNERREVSDPFPIRAGETAYLFLQHFIRKLKAGGRAAIVIKNTFLSNTDQASVALRRELLQTCDLQAVLDMPEGTFSVPAKTVVLFFEKGRQTKVIWYYELKLERNLGKLNPLSDEDLSNFQSLQLVKACSDFSWIREVSNIARDSLDLSVQNPRSTSFDQKNSRELSAELASLEAAAGAIQIQLPALLIGMPAAIRSTHRVTLGDVCRIEASLVDPRLTEFRNLPHVGGANIVSGTGRIVDVKSAAEEKLISGKYSFFPGVVLYSKIRPYLRKVARPDFPGLCSADVYPLVPMSDAICRDFLFHILLSRTFTAYAVKGSARVGMPKVNQEHLFAFEFDLPKLDEQERVAGCLDDVSEKVVQLRQIKKLQEKLLADLPGALASEVLGIIAA